MGISAEGVVHK